MTHDQNPMTNLHASCISINGKAVLILGKSGSGKSDLALRLIDSGATLVADDRVILTSPSPLEGEGRGGGTFLTLSSEKESAPHPNPPPQGGRELFASPAPRLECLLEVRGIGIMRLPYVSQMPVALAIQLVAADAVERMPEPQFFDCLDVQVPLLSLHAFHSSTPAKIRAYLAMKGNACI